MPKSADPKFCITFIHENIHISFSLLLLHIQNSWFLSLCVQINNGGDVEYQHSQMAKTAHIFPAMVWNIFECYDSQMAEIAIKCFTMV